MKAIKNMLYYIYKITIGNKIYIGSTTNPYRRWSQHKSDAKELSTHAHYQIYIEMRLIGIDNCVFEILYEIECVDETEARKAEQAEIDKHPKEIILNNNYAYRSKKEWQKEYQKTDKYKEYQRQYKKTDKYKEYQKTDKSKNYKKEWVNRPEVKERRNRLRRERRAKKKLELKPISIV